MNNLNTILADPLIIEVYLYSSNYKDRILIGELKEEALLLSFDDENPNSFYVRASEVDDIINTKFKKDLWNFESTPVDQLGSTVTSVYFIDNLLGSFTQLKYIKFNVSDSPIYSRMNENYIDFPLRVIQAKINIPKLIGHSEAFDVRDLLIKSNLYKYDRFQKKPYLRANALLIHSKLNEYSDVNGLDQNDDDYMLIDIIKSLIGDKLYEDQTELLLIIEP